MLPHVGAVEARRISGHAQTHRGKASEPFHADECRTHDLRRASSRSPQGKRAPDANIASARRLTVNGSINIDALFASPTALQTAAAFRGAAHKFIAAHVRRLPGVYCRLLIYGAGVYCFGLIVKSLRHECALGQLDNYASADEKTAGLVQAYMQDHRNFAANQCRHRLPMHNGVYTPRPASRSTRRVRRSSSPVCIVWVNRPNYTGDNNNQGIAEH